MPEAMDPAIKLFGRTIPLPEVHSPPEDGDPDGGEKDLCKEVSNAEVKDSTLSEEMEPSEPNCSSGLDNDNELDHQTPTKDDKATPDPKSEQDETETDASGKEKPLKKPDKILPCPRCRSFDTKFCYYNNYNVNQPRHFCKNCQRYWTAGGTMRNVPVGAGRRKNKQHSSHYRQLTMASDFPDPTHHQPPSTAPSDTTRPMKTNGTVMKFGPEAPLCESMASALNLREKKRNSELSSMEDDQETSVTASNHAENGFTENGFTESNIGVAPMHPLQCYPWAFPMVAGPAFCAPAVPFPFMPAAFWGCMNVPWIGANGIMPPPSSASINGGSRNGFPNLGKHSRDANPHSEEKTEKSLWVPKTLRIDDEAAKSSIWASLGIKPDEGCIFKAFRSKAERKVPSSDSVQALHANPAALSRSRSFQEST